MLPLAPKTGMLFMALWQFIVIAVLIAALLVYASVLTRRVGRTNAALKRIEEALLVTGGLIAPAAAGAADAMRSPEVSGKGDAARYLTIRDLRVRSDPRNSHATRSNSEDCVPISPESRERSRRIGLMSSPATRPENENCVAASLDSRDALNTSSELPSVHASRGENGNSVASSSESSDALNTSGELPSSPATRPMNGDSVAKKNRDALLILMSQRRRRRARQGY